MELIVEEENLRIDKYLAEKTEFSRSTIAKMIENEFILVNDKKTKNNYLIKNGDKISINEDFIEPLDITPEDISLNIVYEDDDIIVLNKESGMVVHPGNGNSHGTLVNALLYHTNKLSDLNGEVRPGIVHRIDKDTSGLLLIAKNDKAHLNLSKQIETKNCHRHYLALCVGNFKDDYGTITTHIDLEITHWLSSFWTQVEHIKFVYIPSLYIIQ